MPGFVVEEGFPLARFQNTIGSSNINNNFIVDLNNCGFTSPSTDHQNDHALDAVDQVAVTIQGEGIKLYDTTMQKCLNSWTTPPGTLFGQAAVYSPASGGESLNFTYALIDAGSDITKKEERKTVWMWKDAQNNEKIASSATRESKTFKQRIQAIHISPALRSNIILVNENGSIDLVSKDLDRFTANYKAEKKEHVLWSTVFVTSSSHVRPCCIPNSMVPANSTIVVTVCQSKESTKYTLKLYYINEERRSINIAVSTDLEPKYTPVSFTFDATLGILTVLESDGTWTVNNLTLKHRPSNKIAAYLEQRLKIHFKNYQIYDEKLGKIASMAPLADNFVALVAPRIARKGSKIYEHVLSIWDVKYGTLQAEQIIKPSEKQLYSENCIYQVNVLRNSHVAVTISSTIPKTDANKKSSKTVTDTKSIVTLFPYYNQPMSLMGAMNKMKATSSFLDINMNDLSDKSNIGLTRSGQGAVSRAVKFGTDDTHAFEDWTTKLRADQNSEEEVLRSLMDHSVSKKAFTVEFMKHVRKEEISLDEDLSTSSGSSDGKTLDDNRNLCTNVYNEFSGSKRKTRLSSQFVSLVASRIFATKLDKPDMSLWSPSIILYLMSQQQLRSGYIDGGLIKGLVERDAWYLVPAALKSVIDISEMDLVMLIKALVSLIDTEPSVWKDQFEIYLRSVIESPRNDIFMKQALKQLTVAELPVLLKTITQWLEGNCSKTETIKLSQSSDKLLENRNNIIEFTSNLLDVHFPMIILEPSLHETLVKLQMSLESLSNQVQDLEDLRGTLTPFERTLKLQKKHAIKKSGRKNKGSLANKNSNPLLANPKYGSEEGIPVYRVEMFSF
ncbi:hypothetical protein BCR42DRAFT_481740 [Absidia repens]|uniref:Uncharacterized protein n=1 Tax=Absidia repens TaxID=90262 RepID=A0A1X2IP96_9FUNG|nr:hypothetical protein BCR42DRAFT_481740 [Absidia repens]